MFVRGLLVGLLLTPLSRAGDAEIAAAIASIRSVGKEGAGNPAAASAWKVLAAEGGPALIPTLAAFRDASPSAANWLRSAIDAITEAEARAGRKLPADALKAFVQDGRQSADARRIAFELFEKLQPEEAAKLIAGLIDDPSLDLRRDAIARRIALAEGGDKKLLEPLFTAARDRDQVEDLATRLGKTPEDVARHFNFITRWHIIGPFDGPGASGFSTRYAPEDGVDLKATYTGKGGQSIAWKIVDAKDMSEQGAKDYCLVDLTQEIGKIKDCVAYGFCVIEVDKETPVEVRGASQNGVKFFLNGRMIFEREAYHQGTVQDQHAGKATLKAGRNEILCKICQNDQPQPWAQKWCFQMRLCDSTGGAVPFRLVSPEAR